MTSNLFSPFPDWITLHGHCSPHGCQNGGRRHEPLTGVGYGTGTGVVSMLLRDDGAVFHVTGLLRTDGRYLCANGLHAVAVTLCTRQIVQHRVSLV